MMNENIFLSTTLFVLLGVSSLLPWNAFISASQYFSLRFCDNDNIKRSFESVFSVIYMTSQLSGLLSQLYLASIKRLNHNILVPVCINSLVFTIIFASLFTTTSAFTYFLFISVNVFILGYTSVFLSAGTFQLAAEMNSSKYASLLMIGQGLSGIISSLLSYCLNYEIDKSNWPSWYFGFITVLLLVSVLLSLVFKRKSYQYEPILDRNDIVKENSNNIELSSSSSSSSATTIQEKSTISTIMTTSYELLPFTIPITLIFIVTLSVFPGLISMIKSCSKHDNKFISLLFFMYNITDTLGKYLSYYFQEYSSSILYSIQIVSVIRLIFIPIFLSFQNIVTDPSDIEINCNSCSVCMNVFPVIAISLLGLSNGFSSSLAMMHWPKVTNEHSIGATIMIFSISLGLTLGAVVSLIITMNL